jgi:DNA-directed RNA polymerase alpha subunit
MRMIRKHFMKTGSACGKNVCGGSKRRDRCSNPAPELPDATLIESVRFSTGIRNALKAAGMKTVGDIRETSDATLRSLPDLGPGSLAHLREKLGLPSTDGVRPGG